MLLNKETKPNQKYETPLVSAVTTIHADTEASILEGVNGSN